MSAIAMKAGIYDRLIVGYKYGRLPRMWAVIFGRLLLGHLQEHWGPRGPLPYDLVVAAPSFPSPDGTGFHHTELVLDAAAREDVRSVYPFDTGDPRAILKTAPTPQSAGARGTDKKERARALLQVLRVPRPAAVAGKRVLVYDDVLTTGWTLHAVAVKLRNAGALLVDGVVLARQPWVSP